MISDTASVTALQQIQHMLQQCYSSLTVVLQQKCYCRAAPDCGSESRLHIVAVHSSLQRVAGTNINDTSVIRKRNLNGQIRQTAVQPDWRLCTRGQSDERYEET